MLHTLLPTPKILFENELKTLEFLRGNSTIATYFPEFLIDADNSFFKLKGLINKPSSFGFESCIKNIFFLDNIHQIYFGGLINLENSKTINDISYYLCICGYNDNDNYIIRKYHFDYTNPSNERRSPHPVFHLHYPGGLSTYLKSFNLDNNHMDSWLSEPRIFFTPMSFALLLNLIFKEFHNPADDSFNKIRENSYWRTIVIDNENLFLKPYYERCHIFLDRRYRKIENTNTIFTTDYCYAN